MKIIKEILEKDNLSIEDLIYCFEQVKKNGDIAVIKFDGERDEIGYTIFISFPLIKKREMIRADENSLKVALIKVLTKYLE
ncbi:hypothetical protein [Flavobacterium restrictum]|uniref:Uncharacterized protein n=1 Tax=Flavobacterium restrictum TaxID=2594428 RepID=A0A553DQJ9_9FLAO|nr:hypothetical protein [Flavobacterium restrictum]TRX35069.1 hypothetical protein FNW21_15565 [Flavobacterium restrictum]